MGSSPILTTFFVELCVFLIGTSYVKHEFFLIMHWWPRGLRRHVQVVVSSGAQVRTLLSALFVVQRLFNKKFYQFNRWQPM